MYAEELLCDVGARALKLKKKQLWQLRAHPIFKLLDLKDSDERPSA